MKIKVGFYVSSYPPGYWSFFTLCKYLFSCGNLLCFFVGSTWFVHVFTAGFAKPGLEMFSKHCESIITASFAQHAVISYLELSIAPVKIPQTIPTAKQIQ